MIFDRQADLRQAGLRQADLRQAEVRPADPGTSSAELATLGETRTPSIADLFVAKMEAA
jgi:hypothetical protein